MYRRPRLKLQLVYAKAHEFGNTQAPGERKVKHGTIAHPVATPWIGGIENGLHLVACEEAHQCLVGLLRRDGEESVYLRVFSRSSRNARIKGSSSCSSIRSDGRVLSRLEAKESSRKNAYEYASQVWMLARRSRGSRSPRNAVRWGASGVIGHLE
jgi:hypothetical protein